MKNVIDMGKEKTYPITGELVDELREVLYSYAGRVSSVEALGALELVKIIIAAEQLED